MQSVATFVVVSIAGLVLVYFISSLCRVAYDVLQLNRALQKPKQKYEPPTIKRIDPKTLSPELQAWVADVTRKKD